MTKEKPRGRGYGIKILVVDDEERIRDACQMMLVNEGYEVALAENGFAGLKKIEEEHFDILLLDLMMPGMRGIDLLTHVKDKHPDTLVIVITGYATLEHAIEAMKKGAFDFVSKPFSPQDLRSVTGKAIEYIRTLEDIAHEKSRMGVLINHISDGVMATDAQKRVALANPAFLKMTGHPGDSVIGKPVTDLIQNESLLQVIDKALAMPAEEFGEVTEELAEGTLDDKGESVLAVRCVPFRDRLHRNLGTVTVMHDITALKKMDQMKSDFVSMVAHEIKGPMNSVLALVKVIRDRLAGDLTEKQEELLGRVSEKIKGLADMTAELLDLSKIESGLITMEKEKLHIEPLLRDQVAFHLPKAEARKIRLSLAPLPELAPVLANQRSLEEVVSNLIGNAIRYTPEGGSILLSAAADGERVRISVQDTGFGISKEEQERIFERFYRVKTDQTRFIAGTGLGLAIVKSIVEAHNGAIRVESEPGKGSTFHVYLPAMRA
ncbi:MAG: response regulator [Deltaproteobacteria bacterium]|nr:response regulator [Deltaproteobacteria bacterium]